MKCAPPVPKLAKIRGGGGKTPFGKFPKKNRFFFMDTFPKATGENFNKPGHSLANMKFTILEQAKQADDMYRKEREIYFINKFRTLYKGINRID